jgi:hypothetical protein
MKPIDAKNRRKEVAAIANLLHFAELSAQDLGNPFLAYLIRLARHEAGGRTLTTPRSRRSSAQAPQNLN